MTPQELCVIYASAFPDMRAWSADEFKTLLAQEQMHLLRCDAGFAILQLGIDQAELITIAIHPDQQGQGHGRNLTVQAIEKARHAQLDALILEVAATNARAISLYGSLGFAKIAQRKDYYRLNSGEKTDALIYRLVL